MAFVVGVVACTDVAVACNVPVFRYALERWQPDSYRAVVFHRGPLTVEQAAWLAGFEPKKEGPRANLKIRAVDVEAMANDDDGELLASLGDVELPQLVLQYPASLRNDALVWHVPFDGAARHKLTESPVREELVKRLADGQTAVWLLLESGDTEKDAAAAETLNQQLEDLTKSLRLPELTDSIDDFLLSKAPLRIEFSVLRASRQTVDPVLLAMLRHSEFDLADLDGPMAFPVFGRGRAMFGLVGKGISAQNIHDSAAFLTGACSCQVKEQNPGFDLLLTANWDARISREGMPAITSRETKSDAKPEVIPIPRGSRQAETATPERTATEQPTAPTGPPRKTSWLLYALAATAALLLVRSFTK